MLETRERARRALAVPEFPGAAERAWGAFQRLNHRRGPGMMGPAPIAWEAIDAFLRLSGLALSPWEIELVELLDNVLLSILHKESSWTPESDVAD